MSSSDSSDSKIFNGWKSSQIELVPAVPRVFITRPLFSFHQRYTAWRRDGETWQVAWKHDEDMKTWWTYRGSIGLTWSYLNSLKQTNSESRIGSDTHPFFTIESKKWKHRWDKICVHIFEIFEIKNHQSLSISTAIQQQISLPRVVASDLGFPRIHEKDTVMGSTDIVSSILTPTF